MRCKEIAQSLSEYVDGVLAAGQVEPLEQHLADCELCRQKLADLRQTLSILQELEEVAPPADLLARVHAQLEAEAAPATAAPARRLWLALNTPLLRFAAAASLVALISIQTLRHSKTGSKTIAPPAVSIVAPLADEEALPALELEESLSEPAEAGALPAPVAAVKRVVPRRRQSGAEADGEIWGGAEDVGRARKARASREVSPGVPGSPAPSLQFVPAEERIDVQEGMAEDRALRVVPEVAKEEFAPRVETITVVSVDPAVVMQQVARFTQEPQVTGRSADKSRVGALDVAGRKLKEAAAGGAVLHARVPADRYEELVAALRGLGRAPAGEDPQVIVTVVVTIIQP